MGLGATELIVILLIVVLLFGASKIPELGKSVGQGIKSFKDGLRQEDDPPPPPPPAHRGVGRPPPGATWRRAVPPR
jgi:sec-independent protein translocase protein TatA